MTDFPVHVFFFGGVPNNSIPTPRFSVGYNNSFNDKRPDENIQCLSVNRSCLLLVKANLNLC